MEDKSKNSKVLVIVLIAVIAILAAVGITMGVLLMNNNSSQTQDTVKQQGVVFDSDASHSEKEVSNAGGAEQGIKIPGYPDMTISSESTDFPITLLNPEGIRVILNLRFLCRKQVKHLHYRPCKTW